MLLEARMPTILVVEDDPVSREALGGILTGRGWIVAEAATLAAGLAGLEPEPTCVILDLMLPDGDGSMILHAARSSGLKTRFVVTTGVDDPNRLQALARLEPDALLQKPVAFEDLYQACLGPGSGV
jgi:CheY-like chemotaxis protein